MNEEFFPEHLFMVIFSMFMVKLDEEFWNFDMKIKMSVLGKEEKKLWN